MQGMPMKMDTVVGSMCIIRESSAFTRRWDRFRDCEAVGRAVGAIQAHADKWMTALQHSKTHASRGTRAQSAHEGEVLGIEEEHNPAARIILQRNLLDLLVHQGCEVPRAYAFVKLHSKIESVCCV